jgi:hypothetical protein
LFGSADAARRTLISRGLPLLAGMLVGACTAIQTPPPPTPEPAALAIPADWVTFTSGAADFRVALPPWLVRPGSPDIVPGESGLWANEPLAAGEAAASMTRVELRVNGPGSLGDPPEDQDLPAMLRFMHGSETAGVPVITRVVLPAGPAVRLERVDLRGSPEALHLLAFLIETPAGLAYVQVHGYEFAWHERAADVELIVQGLRIP